MSFHKKLQAAYKIKASVSSFDELLAEVQDFSGNDEDRDRKTLLSIFGDEETANKHLEKWSEMKDREALVNEVIDVIDFPAEPYEGEYSGRSMYGGTSKIAFTSSEPPRTWLGKLFIVLTYLSYDNLGTDYIYYSKS